MKKTIVIATKFDNTKVMYKELLSSILGDRFKIESINFSNYSGPALSADLLLISTPYIINSIRPFIQEKTKIIPITRTFTLEAYQMLLSIQEKENMILVNNGSDVTVEATTLIYTLGFNFRLHPYYPDLDVPRDIKVAITTNEAHLVPDSIDKVYNIGHMVYSVSTINEVLEYLEMDEENKSDILYNYQMRVISTEKGLHTLLDSQVISKSEMQAMLDLIDEGVVRVDAGGNISLVNKAAEEIFDQDKNLLYDTSISSLLGNSIQNLNEEIKDCLVQYKGEYLLKDSKPTIIHNNTIGKIITLKKVTKLRKLEEQVRKDIAIKGHIAKYEIGDIMGKSKNILSVKEVARKVSTSDSSVLLTGESGTGKELFAQAIHNESLRKEFPFIAINCAALPENLIESELFGYEKGAFTGANQNGKPGLFEEAHLGTLFLDEIGDISSSLQAKLLRVLEEGESIRVGGHRIRKVDVRIIAATNKDLLELAQQNRFRWDLYYRLNVFPIEVPPLRERKEDLKLIFMHYLDHYNPDKKVSDSLMEILLEYDWPGNVRELRNIAEYLALMGNKILQPTDLPKSFTKLIINNFAEEDTSDLTLTILNILDEQKKARKRTGRNTLLILLEEKGWLLTEREIRSKMDELKQEGYIHIGKGRQGSTLTDNGKLLISQ